MAVPKAKTKSRTRLQRERPRLYKVLLLNDDVTPRDFVVTVLKQVFGMAEARAHAVMWAAHTQGVAVVAVYTRDVAETKATAATEEGQKAGYPLHFATEPEA